MGFCSTGPNVQKGFIRLSFPFGAFNFRNLHPSAVKFIEQGKGFGVVFLQSFGTVFRPGASHVEIAVSAEVPHGELGKEFIGIGAGVGLLPEAFFERAFVLLVEFCAQVARDAVTADVMGELVEADVTSAIAVFFELEEVLLAAGGQQTAHAASAFIAGQPVIFVELHALVMTPFGQIGSDLVTPDNVKLGSGGDEVGNHGGLITQQHREAIVSREEGFIDDDGWGFDRNAVKAELFGEKILFRRRYRADGGSVGRG